MPPRKRTNQPKHAPPASPATIHGASDQHHHLRHTGSGISARTASVGITPAKLPPAPTSETTATQKDSHEEGSGADLPSPRTRTSLAKFTYVLSLSALLFLGWYLYGMATLIWRMREEIGWWGIIVGDPGAMSRWALEREDQRFEPGPAGGFDAPLSALADALGISPIQIASAVKPLIPEASLASIASKAVETGAPEAVIRVLIEDTARDDRGGTNSAAADTEGFPFRKGTTAGNVAKESSI